ncbi:hypothetical protein LX36DRAFT_63474 [Colletotrichum falcatum]|nr:hypothetical protein LX36DRAFT_63474 [Colletotrichum falcatum]
MRSSASQFSSKTPGSRSAQHSSSKSVSARLHLPPSFYHLPAGVARVTAYLPGIVRYTSRPVRTEKREDREEDQKNKKRKKSGKEDTSRRYLATCPVLRCRRSPAHHPGRSHPGVRLLSAQQSAACNPV